MSCCACRGPLHCFSQGASLLSDWQFAEDFDNRLHYFVEDCDLFQVSERKTEWSGRGGEGREGCLR